MIECTTPWHEVSGLVELGIGSFETKDVSIVENGFELLNQFELSSIRPAVVQSKEALLSLLMAQDLLKL